MKKPEMLDVIALKRDLPDFNLKAEYLGTVVEVFEPDAVMVEFLDGDGDTVALLDLHDEDARIATKRDIATRQYPDPLPAGVHPPIADVTRPALA